MFESWGSYIAVAVAILIAVLWVARSKHDFKAPQTKAFDPKIFKHYIKCESLFVNAAEQTLYSILYQKLTPRYHVFSKVRLEDIIGVRAEKLPAKVVWSLRGRVKSRHVDFLITTPQGRPLMVIELDGSSHLSRAAMRPDCLKNGLAHAVGLPLKRVQVGHNFHNFVSNIQSDLSRL